MDWYVSTLGPAGFAYLHTRRRNKAYPSEDRERMIGADNGVSGPQFLSACANRGFLLVNEESRVAVRAGIPDYGDTFRQTAALRFVSVKSCNICNLG
jgi:hypothetical protein